MSAFNVVKYGDPRNYNVFDCARYWVAIYLFVFLLLIVFRSTRRQVIKSWKWNRNTTWFGSQCMINAVKLSKQFLIFG